MFNPFKKNRKATDMTTPENDPTTALPASATPYIDSAAMPDLPANEAPAVATAEQRLAGLEAKHTEVADAYLRAKAEGENIRRRADEDIAKARRFAIESFAESLLPVRRGCRRRSRPPGPTTRDPPHSAQPTAATSPTSTASAAHPQPARCSHPA